MSVCPSVTWRASRSHSIANATGSQWPQRSVVRRPLTLGASSLRHPILLRGSPGMITVESDGMTESEPERRFRTLFISDVHLGTRGCQADRLLDFLKYHDADTIYLVGDIVDGWALKASWYW